jgi:hypothetical protein
VAPEDEHPAGRPEYPAHNAGTTRSPGSSPCKPNTPPGMTSCQTICVTLAAAAAVQAIADLDLDDLVSIEPPRGFGRN